MGASGAIWDICASRVNTQKQPAMSNSVWIRWKDSSSGTVLFDTVRYLEDEAQIKDLRFAFVEQQRLPKVTPAAVQVRQKECGETLEPDQKLTDYFVPVSDSNAAAGPGRSKDSALLCTLPSPTPQAPDIERLLPLISVLPAVIKEVGISRKTRLNPWARESMRTSGSKRSKPFRKMLLNITSAEATQGRKSNARFWITIFSMPRQKTKPQVSLLRIFGRHQHEDMGYKTLGSRLKKSRVQEMGFFLPKD